MKKFEPEVSAYTPPLSYESPENKSFDLSKLLQILPKLNLSGLFGAKQNNAAQQENTPHQIRDAKNFMRRQNYIETQRQINTHNETIKRIREENSTMQ